MSIPYGRHSIADADIEAVDSVLRSDWLTQGPVVEAFERDFASVTGAPYAVAFANGTAALHGAIVAAGVEGGDEVVTSAMTFAASANCAAYVNATPRFADIDSATWNVSPDSVAAAVNPNTRAAVPVHFTGLAAPVRDIRQRLGEEICIIEDAAHALGAQGPEGPVGACHDSDMAVFSFHPVKAIAAGEGGMVTTRDRGLRDRLRSFRNHGFVRPEPSDDMGGWWYEQRSLGFNYRLSDIHSALGSSQLRRLEAFIERRNEIALRYREELAELEQIELPPMAPAGSRHAYHLFVIRHRGGEGSRRRLYDRLRDRGVLTQVHYIPVYWHPWYRDTFGYRRGLCPGAERYYHGAITLPCYPGLAESDQHTVVRAVRASLSE
jgi:UDP-4-amino-4,6-dideoxy-N-acetyl-beta-L-altrosamine transaminase